MEEIAMIKRFWEILNVTGENSSHTNGNVKSGKVNGKIKLKHVHSRVEMYLTNCTTFTVTKVSNTSQFTSLKTYH